MKKIFTLIAMAVMAVGANAQTETTETWSVANEDGKLKADYVANPDPNAMSVVEFSTANVTGTHVSGPIAGYKQGPNPELEPIIDNAWGSIQTKKLSEDGSVAPFYYVQGTGNPVDISKVVIEAVIDEGEPTGDYRANWEASYYQPDGSMGFPTNGTYVTVKAAVKGAMQVAAWMNKDNRAIYVVKKSDAKALALGTEVIASGYVNGANWDVADDSPLKGYPMYQDRIEPKGTEDRAAFVVGPGNQAVWIYLTFDAEADETYYVFNYNTQIGFGGIKFDPNMTKDEMNDATSIEGVKNVNNNIDTPMYNLAGQKVGNDYKGIVIKNGKKFVNK